MSPLIEKRLLQAALVIGGALSLVFAVTSVIEGVHVLLPGYRRDTVDLDSHFRYLSGIFLGALIVVYSCVPDIERKGPRLRLVGGLVICGGLARLIGVMTLGIPGLGFRYGLVMELIVTPLILLWQARVAQRMSERAS